MYEVSTLEKDTKICTVTGSTKKAFFSEILSQDMNSNCFLPKTILLIGNQQGQLIRDLAFWQETA